MKSQIRRALVPLLGVLIFVGALFALHFALRHYRYHDIVRELHQLPRGRLLAALFLTLANYLVLTGYDTVGLKYLKHELPYPRIALASFVGYGFSQNLGFPYITGTPVRYRLYSAWGLSAIEVTQIVVFNSITFFLGLFTLGGFVFLFEPVAVPRILHLPFASARPLGALFLIFVATYVVWSRGKKQPIHIGDWEFAFPTTGIALRQIAVSSVDWLLAGTVFYAVVHPAHMSFPAVLAVFLLAQMAGLASHIPAGLGVFEVVVLFFLSPPLPAATVLGALVAYRGIYYLLPLLCACALLAGNEFFERREHVRRFARTIGRWAPGLAPQILAFTVFVGGAILLFSGATPAVRSRIRFLHDFLPLPIMEVSHFLATMAGVGLLLLGRGLQRRLDAAYHMTVALLTAGIVLSVLKGGDFEQAIALSVILVALVPSRRYFYRTGALIEERFTAGWIAAVAVVLLASVWLGIFSFKHVDYNSFGLLSRFALHGDAPRFLRATVGACAALLLVGMARLLRPAPPEPTLPGAVELARAESIVRREKSTVANLALLGDKSLLFSASGNAFIMYGIEGRSWVSMGDPVGADDEKAELIWEYRELCDRHSGWPVFYQVRTEQLPLYLDVGLTLLKIGEEARVRLADFTLDGAARESMRRVKSRLDKEGCSVDVVPPEQVDGIMPQLRRISDAWLESKHTHEKHFSLGFFDEAYLRRFPIAVVRAQGTPVAFANLWVGAAQEEISVDLMRYAPDAPEEAMEYLFVELMLWARQQGYGWFNLGMAPLSGLENRALAPLWSRLGALVFRYGENFYSFQGLRQYKESFDPVWEPRYVASPGGLPMPRVLTNIGALISRGANGNTPT